MVWDIQAETAAVFQQDVAPPAEWSHHGHPSARTLVTRGPVPTSQQYVHHRETLSERLGLRSAPLPGLNPPSRDGNDPPPVHGAGLVLPPATRHISAPHPRCIAAGSFHPCARARWRGPRRAGVPEARAGFLGDRSHLQPAAHLVPVPCHDAGRGAAIPTDSTPLENDIGAQGQRVFGDHRILARQRGRSRRKARSRSGLRNQNRGSPRWCVVAHLVHRVHDRAGVLRLDTAVVGGEGLPSGVARITRDLEDSDARVDAWRRVPRPGAGSPPKVPNHRLTMEVGSRHHHDPGGVRCLQGVPRPARNNLV